MQVCVVFKGRLNDNFIWENTADSLPKQIYSNRDKILINKYPKVNQQYVIYFEKFNGNYIIRPYEIVDHYTTCSYFKVLNGEFYFKKGINKGFSFTQISSAFINNPELEKSLVKSLVAIYKKSNNILTKNNIIRLFNSGRIRYCEVFGFSGNVIQIGRNKGVDISKVNEKEAVRVLNKLEYYKNTFISPVTQNNCQKNIDYLIAKYPKLSLL